MLYFKSKYYIYWFVLLELMNINTIHTGFTRGPDYLAIVGIIALSLVALSFIFNYEKIDKYEEMNLFTGEGRYPIMNQGTEREYVIMSGYRAYQSPDTQTMRTMPPRTEIKENDTFQDGEIVTKPDGTTLVYDEESDRFIEIKNSQEKKKTLRVKE